jgi:hypothetical protein
VLEKQNLFTVVERDHSQLVQIMQAFAGWAALVSEFVPQAFSHSPFRQIISHVLKMEEKQNLSIIVGRCFVPKLHPLKASLCHF